MFVTLRDADTDLREGLLDSLQPDKQTSVESEYRGVMNALASESHSLWYYSWKRLRRNRLAMAGLFVITALALVAMLADVIAPFNPNQQILEYSVKPSLFRGNVLYRKSENGTNEKVSIPITGFRAEGIRYFIKILQARKRRFLFLSLQARMKTNGTRNRFFCLGQTAMGATC